MSADLRTQLQDTLGAAYTLERELGGGGMSRVFLRRIEASPEGVPGRTSALSRLYLGLGDTSRALSALEKAAAGDGDLVLSQIVSSPHLDQIRQSPRFAAVLRRFNLDVARVTAPDGGRSH